MLHDTFDAVGIVQNANQKMRDAFHTRCLNISRAGLFDNFEWIFSHVSQIYSLTSLDMRYCEALEELPASISRLANLKELNLNGCKYLRGLPASIGQLKSLEVLRMGHRYSATSLPRQLGELKKLRVLVLYSWEKLAKLPSCVCKLTSLTYLDLNFCFQLKRLPSGMKHMRSLAAVSCIGMTSKLFRSRHNLEVMHGIPNLATFNYKPADAYLKWYGAARP